MEGETQRRKRKIPKLKTTLAKGVEPIEGQAYKVLEISEVTTAVSGFKGYRVKLEPLRRKEDDDKEYASMLWKREEAGISSKLGSFMAAFLEHYGDEDVAFDTDSWIGATVLFKKWEPRNRAIEVVEGPR